MLLCHCILCCLLFVSLFDLANNSLSLSHKNDVQSVADGDKRRVEIKLHRSDIRRSGTQIDVTVTCLCHSNCCLPYPKSLAS